MAIITPYITRRTFSFGISIMEEAYNHEVVRKIRDHYRNSLLICYGVIIILLLIPFFLKTISNEIVYYYLIATVIEMILAVIFYLIGYFQMNHFKKSQPWINGPAVIIVDTTFHQRKKLISPLWFLVNFIIIIITLGIGFLMYEKMPSLVPYHWGIHGEVNGWAHKSYKLLFVCPLIQLYATLMVGLDYWMISILKQQVDVSQPEKSIEQDRIFRYRWSAFSIFTGISGVILIGFIQSHLVGLIQSLWVSLTLSFICIGAIMIAKIVLAENTGQGGSRVLVDILLNKNLKKASNPDEDQYWKLGWVYYNPKDPTLAVEKRFGFFGWAFNFGRLAAWLISSGIIIVTVLFLASMFYILNH